MNDKIPTAEEFLSDNINRTVFPHIDNELEDNSPLAQTLKSCLIEFAKIHRIAILEAAANNVNFDFKKYPSMDTHGIEIDEDSILNAYPENLIV